MKKYKITNEDVNKIYAMMNVSKSRIKKAEDKENEFFELTHYVTEDGELEFERTDVEGTKTIRVIDMDEEFENEKLFYYREEITKEKIVNFLKEFADVA